MYVDSGTSAKTISVGVYADSNGQPGSLLFSQSATPVAGRWNQLSLASAPAISNSKKYWLALLGTGGTVAFRDENPGTGLCSQNSSSSSLTALPSTWSAGPSWGACLISAYVSSSAVTTTAPANSSAPTVSGQAIQGQTLTASTGSWSGSPTSYAYQWQDCDSSGASCSAIAGATASSYALAAGDVGHTIRAVVTAANAGGSSSAASAPTSVVTAPVTTATLLGNSTIAGSADSDSSGSAEAFRFTAGSSGTAGSLSLYLDGASSATSVAVGLYSDSGGHPGAMLASKTFAPSAGAWNTVSLGATPAISSGASYWIAVLGQGGTLAYRDQDPGSGSCSESAAQVSMTALPSAWSTGVSWTTCNLSAYVTGSTSAGTTVTPPANTALPAISGTATQGQTLTASTGTWNGSPTSYAYQWQRCSSSGTSCAAVAGATSASYALGSGDAGSTIRVAVTAANSGGSTSATSAATAVVAASTTTTSPPANTALPQVSGQPTQNQTLTASSGSWSNSPTGYAYSWKDCDSSGANCVAISGATATSYTLAAGDVGHTLRVAVTASNAGGSATATSAQTALVAAATGTPTNCMTTLIGCGYPDAGHNDGVPAGTSLVPYTGPMTITTPGTVINGVSCSPCSLDIEASNVTIQNSRIQGNGSADPMIAVGFSNHSVSGTQFLNDELSGVDDSSSGHVNSVIDNRGTNTITIKKSYIHACEYCLKYEPNGPGALLVQDTYIANDWQGSTPHYEPIYVCPGGGASGSYDHEHDTLLNVVDQTADYIVDNSTCGNLTGGQTINNSLLAGGGFSIYGGGNGSVPATFTNNRFSNYFQTHGQDSSSGGLWPSSVCNLSGKFSGCWGNGYVIPATANWSGNFWDDNLGTVNP